MAEARLQMELAETKAVLQRLRERVSVGTPTVHKNLLVQCFWRICTICTYSATPL